MASSPPGIAHLFVVGGVRIHRIVSNPWASPCCSLYNVLFWYGGASEDVEQLPAMNFQDLLERFDAFNGGEAPGRLRVRGHISYCIGTSLERGLPMI